MLSFRMIVSPAQSTSQSHFHRFLSPKTRPIMSLVTPLESTLPACPASVDSTLLTGAPYPLESTLTKKPGGRRSLWLTRFPAKSLLPDAHRNAEHLHASRCVEPIQDSAFVRNRRVMSR